MRCPACGFENPNKVSHCERCEVVLSESLPTVQLKYHFFIDSLCDLCYRLRRFFDAYSPAVEDVQMVEGKIITRESVRHLLNPADPYHLLKGNPWIALALSLIPGLGHIYLRKTIRGLIFFLLYVILACVHILSPWAFLSNLSYGLLISAHLTAIVDASGVVYFLNSQKWWVFILLIIVSYYLLTSLLYVPLREKYFSVVWPSQVSSEYEEALGCRPLRFYRPSPEKMSSLGQGQIVVYRSPWSRLDTLTHVVVRGRRNQSIERIIGIPGDEIAFKEGQIFINGNELNRSLYPLLGQKIYPANNFHLVVPEGHYFIFPARVIQQVAEARRGIKPQALAQLVRDVALIPHSEVYKVCWNK